MNAETSVNYVSPASKVFEQLARDACQRLYVEGGDATFNSPEVIRGLANYLAYIAELTAKYLNKGHRELLDNQSR